jgi:hypothetical protein
MEVMVATALMGLMLVVLLQILSSIFRVEEGIWKNSRALLLAEKVLQQSCDLASLEAGVHEGREGDFTYQIKVTPQYEVKGPGGDLLVRAALIRVAVFWRERQQTKRLVLETVRSGLP